ncbi:hypothetical protein FF38_10916 [Lucilia cuprina]|uniref:Uncharacterized protein n=1 Tax=Lucilia cuprina TaxID=7375 RepID=A0A0L0CFS1_LUCCU|nr:hypothetical protein FF38_10916 [Lucilia cuprina]
MAVDIKSILYFIHMGDVNSPLKVCSLYSKCYTPLRSIKAMKYVHCKGVKSLVIAAFFLSKLCENVSYIFNLTHFPDCPKSISPLLVFLDIARVVIENIFVEFDFKSLIEIRDKASASTFSLPFINSTTKLYSERSNLILVNLEEGSFILNRYTKGR